MKRLLRRGTAVLLALVCLAGTGLIPGALAEGNDGVVQRIRYLSYIYRDGRYWNHQVGSAPTDPKSSWKYQSSVTDEPCTSHSGGVGAGGYTCNYFDNGYQCYGFANKLFYEVFGVYCSRSRKYYSVDEIAPGDHVRYRNSIGGQHSVLVVERDGDWITVAEANVGGTCLICWGRKINIRELPMLYAFHASNWDKVNDTPFEHAHIEEIDKGREATCTRDGLTDGCHCGICGLVMETQQVIPASGHRGDWQYVTTIRLSDREIETWLQICTVCGTYTYKKDLTYYDWTPGDVNGDGIVDGRDAVRLMKWLAEDDGAEISEKNADLNRDGEADEKDLLFLVKCLAGEKDWPQ